jgi:hypothetical protein
MMAKSKIRVPKDDAFGDRDFEAISDGEETQRSDEIWDYYETHKDEAVDLDEYARKRGIRV